jgi:nucleoside-diphosphate-sugar epimerase
MTNFVLVAGGFVGGGWYWSEVADRLRKGGHSVEVIEQLRSTGTDPAALGDLAAAEAVMQAVTRVGNPSSSSVTPTAGWSSPNSPITPPLPHSV